MFAVDALQKQCVCACQSLMCKANACVSWVAKLAAVLSIMLFALNF